MTKLNLIEHVCMFWGYNGDSTEEWSSICFDFQFSLIFSECILIILITTDEHQKHFDNP